tara:strand:- start:575 stop:1318 length:744 start_codon:yes stop_codon:yes gene_type:complete
MAVNTKRYISEKDKKQMNLYQKYNNFSKEQLRQQGLNEQGRGGRFGILRDIGFPDRPGGGGGAGNPRPPKGRLTYPMDADAGFAISRHIANNPVWQRFFDSLSEVMGNPPEWWTGGSVLWNDIWDNFLSQIEILLNTSDMLSSRMLLDFMRWAESAFLHSNTQDMVNGLFDFLREHVPGGPDIGSLNDLFGSGGPFTIDNVDGVLQFGRNTSDFVANSWWATVEPGYFNTLWEILSLLNQLNLPFRG